MSELLYRLTGRTDGFIWPGFRDYTAQPALVEHADVRAMRRLLQLDAHGNDYFVVGALSTLSAYPEYLGFVPDLLLEPYRIADYRPPGYSVRGAVLAQDRHGPPSVAIKPAAWPVEFEIQLIWAAPTAAVLQRGHERLTIPVRVINSNTIAPEWPAGCGISGRLEIAALWAEGCQVTIFHTPVSYPHAAVAAALKNDAQASEVISASGLMEIGRAHV